MLCLWTCWLSFVCGGALPAAIVNKVCLVLMVLKNTVQQNSPFTMRQYEGEGGREGGGWKSGKRKSTKRYLFFRWKGESTNNLGHVCACYCVPQLKGNYTCIWVRGTGSNKKTAIKQKQLSLFKQHNGSICQLIWGIMKLNVTVKSNLISINRLSRYWKLHKSMAA